MEQQNAKNRNAPEIIQDFKMLGGAVHEFAVPGIYQMNAADEANM
jgi:hypothetical protein